MILSKRYPHGWRALLSLVTQPPERKNVSNIVSMLILTTGMFRLFADELPVEKALLTSPPRVPPPIARNHSAKVIVNLEIVEKTMRLADGVEYEFWTFGGTVPGSFIRIREGDQVEFNLHNPPDNKSTHNIELHAVTGSGAGAAASHTAPGQTSRFNFKALKPGLFVYHCTTQPVVMHVANGMYGLILVEPVNGLSPVDREYYVFQSEFYTEGAHGEPGLQPFSMEKALKEQPEYVVFNGSVGAIAGENALSAKTGETVRLFVGNGGPNLASSFHVGGVVFDWVHHEGGSNANRNVQTTTVPPGGSAIVEFKLETPGTFLIMDHALARSFNKGTLGMIKADGPENPEIYSGKGLDTDYGVMAHTPSTAGTSSMAGTAYIPSTANTSSTANAPRPMAKNSSGESLTRNQRIRKGETAYQSTCSACHQSNGEGMANVFPALAGSDYLMENIDRAIDIVIHGKNGKIVVNGKTYNSMMPPQNLTDGEIANVMNYITNTWGNKNPETITPERVGQIRGNPGNAEGTDPMRKTPVKRDTSPPDDQQIQAGKMLFTGRTRFANKGPSCISCHNVNDATLPVSGGTLAMNITGFGSLPYDALATRILEIPYPHMAEMKAAYAHRPVKEKEAEMIIAYLKNLSEQADSKSKSRLAGVGFFSAGLWVFFLILGVIWYMGRYRKKESVNESIYKRQNQSL